MKRLGYLVATAVAMLAVPAAAQDGPLRAKSPDGRTVALNVRDSSGLRCLSITFADEGPRRTSACVAPPEDGHDDARGLHVVYRGAPEKVAIIHGTVSARTAELKVRLGDGRLLVIRPRNGAYLRVVNGRPRVATVNAHAASGRLIGAADLDPRAVAPLRGPEALFRTIDERGARATVSAFRARIYRERSTSRPAQICMAISRRGAVPVSNVEPGFAGGSACTASRRRILVRYAAGCAKKRVLLYGIAPSIVRRMVLLTASGRRIRVRMAPFPRRLGHPGRAFVVSRTDPGRLTRLEGYAGNGERLASLALTGTGSGCASNSRS